MNAIDISTPTVALPKTKGGLESFTGQPGAYSAPHNYGTVESPFSPKSHNNQRCIDIRMTLARKNQDQIPTEPCKLSAVPLDM